ncbi:MAG TPA: type II secretion system protein [Gemmatimonadaceae bacterium]|nr:type II secretion system protein [Gemmatimonadaceae bacterium]
MTQNRRGAVLLEAIVALAILSIAGSVIVSLATEVTSAMRTAHDADRAMARASAFMDAVSLWPRTDLDRHLGSHPQGDRRLRIERPVPTLYVVALTDSTGRSVLLSTSLFRPEAGHAAR